MHKTYLIGDGNMAAEVEGFARCGERIDGSQVITGVDINSSKHSMSITVTLVMLRSMSIGSDFSYKKEMSVKT